MAELTEEEKKKLREATAGLSSNKEMPQETQDLSLMGLPDISQPPIYSTAAQAFGDVPVNLPMNPLASGPQMSAPPQRLEQPIEEPQVAIPRGGTAFRGAGGVQPAMASARTGGVAQSPEQFGAATGLQGAAEGLQGVFGRALFPTPEQQALNVASGRTGGIQAPVVDAPALTPEDVSGLSFNGSPLTQGSITAPDFGAEAPMMEDPVSPFEGSFLAPDGTTVGLLRGGGRRIMTPEDMSLFDAMNEARGQPSVVGGATPSMPTPEGMQRTMSGGEVMFADPTTAAAIGGRESESIFGRPGQVQAGQAGSPQAEFAARAASGEPLSQEEIAGYQAKAAGMGTTFDPQRGYSRDPFFASQRGPSGIQRASFEAEQRIAGRPDFGQAISDREKRGDDLSLGDYRNMLRAEGWKGSAQTAKAKQMMGEAISEREEAMIDKESKLLDIETQRRGLGLGEGFTFDQEMARRRQGFAEREAGLGRAERTQEKEAKKAAALEESFTKDTEAYDVISSDAGRIGNLVAEAIGLTGESGTTGLTGTILKHLPGTEAHQLSNVLEVVTSKVALDRLAQVKAAGATLGQVSNTELKMLKDSFDALNQGLKGERLRKALINYATQLQKIETKIAAKYHEKYSKRLGGARGGQTQAAARYSNDQNVGGSIEDILLPKSK